MKKYGDWIKHNLLLVFALFVTIPVSAFIAYKNAKIDMLFSDAISDNNLLQAPLQLNDIHIQAIHTHVLKWPIVLIENALGFDFPTHAVMSFILLLVMNAGLVAIFYYFSKKNSSITALSLLLLLSVELMTGINANEGTLTMITIRNIEIPIVIASVVYLMRQRLRLSWLNVLVILLLSITFMSDYLLMYSSVIGVSLYYLYGVWRTKNISSNLTLNPMFYVAIIGSTITARLLIFISNTFGLASFYELSNTNDNLRYVDSFNELFTSVLNNISKIFDVFGAGFFGQKIIAGPFYFINILLLLATIYLSVAFFKKIMKQRKHSADEQAILALFFMYFFAMLVFTILIPRELAGRYFAFVPILGLILLCIKLSSKKFDVSLSIPQKRAIVLIGATLILIFFTAASFAADRIYYAPKYASLSADLGDTVGRVDILQKEKVGAFITMDIYERGYWYNNVVKQQFDEKNQDNLEIASAFCNSFILDRQFSRNSWVNPDGDRVAVQVRGCDLDKIRNRLGNPVKTYDFSKDWKVLIYDRDIRDQLDKRQFINNRFEK